LLLQRCGAFAFCSSLLDAPVELLYLVLDGDLEIVRPRVEFFTFFRKKIEITLFDLAERRDPLVVERSLDARRDRDGRGAKIDARLSSGPRRAGDAGWCRARSWNVRGRAGEHQKPLSHLAIVYIGARAAGRKQVLIDATERLNAQQLHDSDSLFANQRF